MNQSTPYQIVADIGGTNARFACVDAGSDSLRDVRILRGADYDSLEAATRAYMQTLGAAPLPQRICFAIAGAVDQDRIYVTNRGWVFQQSVMAQSLQVPLLFINDFTAQVHAIATMKAHELIWLDDKRPSGKHVYAAVGPGTGLGVGGMTAAGVAIPSEGGHMGFAPQNPHQVELLKLFWHHNPRVEVETILSGNGLARLYWANSMIHGKEAKLAPEAITQGARDGDQLCRQTIVDFMDILAATASDAAMILCAVDGVYICGGIVPRLKGLYDPQRFRERFNAKGPYREFCSRIPLAIVEAADTGLRGCWRALSLSNPSA